MKELAPNRSPRRFARSTLRRLTCLLLGLVVAGSPRGASLGDDRPGPAGSSIDPVSGNFLFPHRADFARPEDAGLKADEIHFKNQLGNRLRGWYLDSPGTDRTILVCMGNTGNISNYLGYAAIFQRGGFDVFLFDYQGFGGSEGVASVMSLAADSLAAFDYLIAVKNRKPGEIGVFGVSLGSVLALMLGARRGSGAVAVEDVFLPSRHVESLKKSVGAQGAAGWILGAVETLILPAVDPLATVPRLRCPLFLLHGENDPLLPVDATLEVASRATVPARVWIMAEAGHAPETLDLYDREYGHQLVRFFGDAFESKVAPDAELDIEPSGDRLPCDVEISVRVPRRRALQIALAGEGGKFHFTRRWVDPPGTSLSVRTEFRPTHASAIAFGYVRSEKGDSWSEDLTELSRSLREFKRFRAAYSSLERGSFRTVEIPGFRGFVRVHAPARGEWLEENLPRAGGVHPRIRPRYARILGEYQFGQPGNLDRTSLPVAELLAGFLPARPATHYDLDDASFTLGFRDLAVAETCFLLARLRLREGKVDEARRLLATYLDILPEPIPPRLTREQVRELRADTDLDAPIHE